MNAELEQLKHLGFLKIFKESYNLIVSKWRHIFSKIFLVFIFPFCFLILADMILTDHLSLSIAGKTINLLDDYEPTNMYNRQMKHDRDVHSILLGVFTLLYFLIGLVVFYLFAISAISYVVACIYASKDTNLKQAIRVVLKAWKKLVVTYLWNFVIQFVYIGVFVALAVACVVIGSREGKLIIGIVIGVILFISFVVGLIYFNVIWSLASVVSVLEECYGLQAFKRSRDLMKGKKKLCIGIYMVFQVLLVIIQGGYFTLALFLFPVFVYVIAGIVFFVPLLGVVLLGFVVQTVLYLVLKSYQNEGIDKSSLGAQLDGYLGPQGRPISGRKNVQLNEV
ncbi:hypothetical protein Syun_014402 [Stephania yunnanensis]|uniref:Glycerophosphoryl diester phosphodiesterase membrane domain-containing protein n=1 Tax=Stephania yunnanensis TaxID=152371 RepID=A0AAP0JJG7_9MAGN